ncbi:MAG: ABC transporter ATP-binding protein [Euryarchaeota archaeon]|nr:ABC transporter ATP-binding protein [Euryarchaeota archaeon]MBU4608423.1 ABC transporter ATP-binding protein [Euryarchaeota archaeon]MBV1729556.1 ABC transporter ATP-binding protein [Methanobacterium sp.]MBV1755651.1 ABC transporter ATP-binding protein [Methanobacterium sp.]MBV1767942.1 ABC transporter ATP-binding protein [Methanobacterium sp.]
MSYLLEMVDGTFSYNKQEKVFEKISFKLKKGDVLCILGANGAGKTTLLKCLNGLIHLDSGKVMLKGIDIQGLKPSTIAKSMGYIPQIHNSTFPFTVLDVVLMGRAPHIDTFSSPSTRDSKIAKKSLKDLKIYHMKDKAYTEISGGEQQLVFIARVLAQEPDVLILDEPTSHLDFGNQIRTMNIVDQLAKKGLSIIMSSHFPDHAFLSAKKVALMKGKSFIDIGPPEEVINEDNMKEVYDINVKIIDIGHRKACIALK